MHFLPNLLTALVLILPVTVKDVVKPVGLENGSCVRIDAFQLLCHKIHRRAEYPAPCASCIDAWDETALGEEDPSDLVSLNLLSQVLFVELRSSALCTHPSFLALSCVSTVPVGSVLRC